MIPQRRGGTPREYRVLKNIRDVVESKIKPYINEALLPRIEEQFGFITEHKLGLKFDVDVQDVGEWILENLRLGFRMSAETDATLALTEAGTGVQSGVLLALHRLEHKAAQDPHTQYILAVEEPEAFLHPQRQKELYQNIQAARSDNLRVIVTTHSPFIVGETPFSRLGLVKRDGQNCALHVAEIKSTQESETFDAYSDEVNAALFFAEKVLLVEGESDARVLRLLLQKKLGAKAHRISVVSASGNKNFSPFLRMIRAWSTAKIPHLVVTDFDSITKSTERAIVAGARAAGYTFSGDNAFYAQVDSALDKGEQDYRNVAISATEHFKATGLNVFVFTSDLEYALITDQNKEAAAKLLNEIAKNDKDYTVGYDINTLRRLIGSKGIPLNPMERPPFKKPFVHRKIADTIDVVHPPVDIARLLAMIDSL
jgi:putative ATP-dependent endonuclease of OLD family